MQVEEIGTDELRRLIEAGRVDDIVAVGLPGAWAVNIVTDACTEDAMTLRPEASTPVLHARYWNSLDQLDRFLQDMGCESVQLIDVLPPYTTDMWQIECQQIMWEGINMIKFWHICYGSVDGQRDVFVYMISGAKVRAPAAAMALIAELGT